MLTYPENISTKDLCHDVSRDILGLVTLVAAVDTGKMLCRWTMIGNLKAGSDSASSDIGQVIYRMKMLGFNAIRLPFTFAALAQVGTLGSDPCVQHYFPVSGELFKYPFSLQLLGA